MNTEKTEDNDEMDNWYSWLVLGVAFMGQAMSVGFYYCFGLLFVEILHTYDVSEAKAG